MKSPTIVVEVHDPINGESLHYSTRRAFNAGIRASEAAVRDLARTRGEMFTGERPNREGNLYTRYWTGDRSGYRVRASVKGTSLY